MQIKEYNKLVRDYIPDIIRRNGDLCEIDILSENEYRQALREKLVEEAQEAAAANEHDLVTELADLYEVIDALMSCYGVTPENVRATQQRRRSERGGFEQRIRLLRTQHGNTMDKD
jgi:predicted house-cleaning noncanonical NTP pyrophosphatase (MazG superfamily)